MHAGSLARAWGHGAEGYVKTWGFHYAPGLLGSGGSFCALAASAPALGSELIGALLGGKGSLQSGARWTDIYGQPIHAHAGHLLLVGGCITGMAWLDRMRKDPSCDKPKAATQYAATISSGIPGQPLRAPGWN